MNDLATFKTGQLPATIEGLSNFILIGKEKIKVHQAKIRAINAVGMAASARKAALEDAQDVASVVIYAEARLGELLRDTERKPIADGSSRGTFGGSAKTLPPGISKQFSHQAQTIAANPDKVERILAEAKEADKIPTPDMVYKLVKFDEAAAKVTAIKSKRIAEPDGKYDVVVIDPPWPMEKIERDCRPNQHGFDYPTMSEDELSVFKIPAAADCHLFLWTTHKFLPMALRLTDIWGFRYVCLFTWHKPGGFQPIGLPQYNSEFIIYARKGSPKFIDTKSFNTCFEAPRGAHSEKPEFFYQTVARVSGECARIDMFSRREIEGFDSWGNEA